MSPQMIEAIALIVAKYGPSLAAQLIAIFQKEGATLEDVRLLLKDVKEYESYGINPPDEKAPTTTAKP